jgi:hypothetical protein
VVERHDDLSSPHSALMGLKCVRRPKKALCNTKILLAWLQEAADHEMADHSRDNPGTRWNKQRARASGLLAGARRER